MRGNQPATILTQPLAVVNLFLALDGSDCQGLMRALAAVGGRARQTWRREVAVPILGDYQVGQHSQHRNEYRDDQNHHIAITYIVPAHAVVQQLYQPQCENQEAHWQKQLERVEVGQRAKDQR